MRFRGRGKFYEEKNYRSTQLSRLTGGKYVTEERVLIITSLLNGLSNQRYFKGLERLI